MLLIVLQSIIFALIDVFAKEALKTVNVFGFVALRFIFATIAGFAIWGKKAIHELKSTSPKYWLFPSACIGLAINLSNVALQITTATSYSFVRNLAVLIVPLIMCILGKRKYKIYDLFLQITIVAGLYLLSSDKGLYGFGWGEVLGFFAAVLIACSLVFGADAVKHISSRSLSIAQLCSGLIICVILGFSTGSFAQADFSLYFEPKILLILLFNALVGTLIGYELQNIALKKLKSNVVGMIQSSYPVFTAMFAHILLNEKLSSMGIVGAVLITICVVVQSALRDY